ncbi:MAG: 50S ribosomal protein L29 [Chitinophagaceae bacterium]|nr:50S ribosomal protein L29 [Chitinophagaceae bacterium]
MSKRVDFLKNIRILSDSELEAKIEEEKLRLKKLEFAHSVSPLENPMAIRTLRRDIARMMTELKQRKIHS